MGDIDSGGKVGAGKKLYDSILAGQRHEVYHFVQELLEAGSPALEIIDKYLQPAMSQVGDLFSRGEYFLPELILSASAMKNASEFLKPYLASSKQGKKQECIVIGTVSGDFHDIGKNLVIALLEGNGYYVVDLGVDVKPEKFVEAVKENDPAVIGFSALLTTTMVNVPVTIKALEDARLRKNRLLAVGGASVTERNAHEWGVEIYAPDAGAAVKRINEVLSDR